MSSIAHSRLWESRPRARSRSRSRSRGRFLRSTSRTERTLRTSRSQRRVWNTDSPLTNTSGSSLSRGSHSFEELLTDDSIRLLSMRQQRRTVFHNGRWERYLDCWLTNRRLPGPGGSYNYNALSYHWGSSDNAKYILCNDQILEVTPNLFDALWQYRKSGYKNPLWVDALCINQKNMKERNHQVHLMTDIYELAELVVVWLGPSTREMELAFDRSHHGRPPWEKTDVEYDTELPDGERIITPVKDQACRARRVQARIEKGLMQILRRPWFERCWVFQEIILADRAVIWCGSMEMKWESFVHHCEALEDGSESMNHHIHELCDKVVLSVEELRTRFRSRSRHDRPPLSRILIDTWHRKASEQKDQIFSILGLVEGIALQADYSLSVRDTYMAAAEACISQDQHLGILCLTELSQTEAEVEEDRLNIELPSWVPRWGSPGTHARLSGSSSLPDFGTLSMSFAAKRRLFRNYNELALQGVAIGYLERSDKLKVDWEMRPFVFCTPCRTRQSLHLDQMLALEHPEELDVVMDLIESMSYYYKTGGCPCTGTPTYCASKEGLPCELYKSGRLELPSLTAPGDWVCAARGGTGFLVLRPRIDRGSGNSAARCVFTLIGVTSYNLTSSIMLSMRGNMTDGSGSTATCADWRLRAMEIVVS